jgi:hypothetical protein
MRRREFITLLGGAAAWVSPARAQEPRGVIGVLGSATSGAFPGAEAAFIEGLTNTGFIEGKNISIEWRWAERQYNRLSSPVGELKAFQYSEPLFPPPGWQVHQPAHWPCVSVTTSLKIPGAVIPRRLFTRPGS